MFDFKESYISSVSYWEKQPTDQPWTLNGFQGTFAYSDHSLIPEAFMNFLIEYFWKELPETRKSQVKAISLDKINSLLNEVWEGPGSMVKISNLTLDLRRNRLLETPNDTKNVLKGYETPTIDSDLDDFVVDSDDE
jgi:hypothetical protein